MIKRDGWMDTVKPITGTEYMVWCDHCADETEQVYDEVYKLWVCRIDFSINKPRRL